MKWILNLSQKIGKLVAASPDEYPRSQAMFILTGNRRYWAASVVWGILFVIGGFSENRRANRDYVFP